MLVNIESFGKRWVFCRGNSQNHWVCTSFLKLYVRAEVVPVRGCDGVTPKSLMCILLRDGEMEVEVEMEMEIEMEIDGDGDVPAST